MNTLLQNDKLKEMLGDDFAQLLLALMDSMYSGMVVASNKNPEKPFVLWNKKATEILGLGPVDAPLEKWPEIYNILDPNTKELMPPHEIPLGQAFNGITVDNKLLLITPINESYNGKKEIYVQCNAKPLFKNNEIVGGIVVFLDVTKSILEKEVLTQEIQTLKTLNNSILSKLQIKG